jgi:hypothetical protein
VDHMERTPMRDATLHEFEITRDEKRKRGWYLAWACKARCDARGNATLPDRGHALDLFELLAAGHAKLSGEPSDA